MMTRFVWKDGYVQHLSVAVGHVFYKLLESFREDRKLNITLDDIQAGLRPLKVALFRKTRVGFGTREWIEYWEV